MKRRRSAMDEGTRRMIDHLRNVRLGASRSRWFEIHDAICAILRAGYVEPHIWAKTRWF